MNTDLSHAKRLYKIIFWTGYISVLITSFIPIAGELNRIRIGPESFRIRLDHFFHFGVYFLISMFYLVGELRELSIFEINPQQKFFLLIIVLATISEFIQLWIPERAFNIFDWLANVSGLATGWVVLRMERKARRKA